MTEEVALEGITVITPSGSFTGSMTSDDVIIPDTPLVPCRRCGDGLLPEGAVAITTETGTAYEHAECPELTELEKRFRWGDR